MGHCLGACARALAKKGKKKTSKGPAAKALGTAQPAAAVAPAAQTAAAALLNRACQLHQQGDLAGAEQHY